MIHFTHTISHPRTMMIHSHNALLTNSAVMHSTFLDQIAFEAVSNTIQQIYLVSTYLMWYILIYPFFLLARHTFFISFSFLDFSFIYSSSSL